jgi:Fungal specific transcription factor domain
LVLPNNSWIFTKGMAIRFAQALGMHRECVNRTFPLRERLLRQRVWRTLYIYDRFYSASLGRPYTIEDADWDDRLADDSGSERLSVEMARIGCILGDICRQVYRPRTISSEAASGLARRLQEWGDSLPPEMTIQSVLGTGGVFFYDRHVLLRLHLAHLNAVILLTRPFLLYVVATAVTNESPSAIPPKHQARGTVARLARACVLSASRSVEIVQSIFVDNARPLRPPFLIYFMFLAGLILLLDGYRDKSVVRNPAIASVKVIMASYADRDPAAKRYHRIFEAMDLAIKSDTDQRENAQARDILGELLYGNGRTVTDPLPLNPLPNKNPGDISLSQPLIDGSMGFTPLVEGDTFNFDFDSSSYWDTMASGDGDFRGMLLSREF